MENKKVLKFDLEPSQIKIKDLLNKQFLDISIDAISDAYPNRNNSHFTKESMEKAIPSVKNKPVLGAFGKGKLNGPNDFDEHNADIDYDTELGQAYWDYENGERILGTVRESDYVGVEEKNGQSWLTFRCCLWTLYNYRAVKSLLKSRKKKVSVEVMVVSSYYDEKGIEVIEEFELLGVTILGDKTMEGIPGAHLTILEKLENNLFKKNVECLQFAYKSLEEANEDSNLENNSNLHNNENNDEDKKGGDAMLTAEQKRGLLEAAVSENFNDEEGCCWAYVCDYTDSEVYVCVDGGEYIRYPYSISEENEVSINKENGTKVLRDWKEFSAENEEEMAEEQEDMAEENPSEDEKPEDEEPEDEKPEEDESCDMEKNNKCNNSAEGSEQENHTTEFKGEDEDNADAEDYPIEINGKTYSVEELKDAYIEITNNYNAVKAELDELKEEKFKQECEKMYSVSCEMFDSEEEFDDSDSEYIVNMKAQIKEKCENKEFSTMEDCTNFVENEIAKYTYQKRKEMKKHNKTNDEKNFSINMPITDNGDVKKNAKDILKNYVNK